MDRRVGKSKMSSKIFVEGFLWVIRTRFSKRPSVQASIEPQARAEDQDLLVEEVSPIAQK